MKRGSLFFRREHAGIRGEGSSRWLLSPEWRCVPSAAWGLQCIEPCGMQASEPGCLRLNPVTLEELYSVLPQFSHFYRVILVPTSSGCCEDEINLQTGSAQCKKNFHDKLLSALQAFPVGKSPLAVCTWCHERFKLGCQIMVSAFKQN